MFNANIRGWINYYGRYYRSALYPNPTAHRPDTGAMGTSEVQIPAAPPAAHTAVARTSRARQPSLFAHWGMLQGYGRTMEPDEVRASRPVLRAPGGENSAGRLTPLSASNTRETPIGSSRI